MIVGVAVGTAGGSCDHQSEQYVSSLRRGRNCQFRIRQKIPQEKEKLIISARADMPIVSYPIRSADDQPAHSVHD